LLYVLRERRNQEEFTGLTGGSCEGKNGGWEETTRSRLGRIGLCGGIGDEELRPSPLDVFHGEFAGKKN